MPQIKNKLTGFIANASDQDWSGNTYDKSVWSEATNSPSVITSKSASSDLSSINNNVSDLTTGMQNQSAINATNQANTVATKQATDLATKQTQAKTSADLTTTAAKEKTAKLLEELKTSISGGAKDTSTYSKETSASGANKDTELETAYKRMQDGTATDADVNNITYAKSKGWVPSGAVNETAPIQGTETTGTTSTETTTPSDKTDTTKFDASGNPLFDKNGQPTIYKMNQDIDKEHEDYINKMNEITNGTFPLTAEEQSQVDALRKTFDKMIDEQKTANKNFEGATTKMGITSGRQRYAGEEQMNIAKDAIDQGISKVADLEAKALSSITALKDAIKTKNYDLIKELHTETNDYLTKKQKVLADTDAAVKAAAKDLRDFNYKVYQDDITNSLASEKFDFDIQKSNFDQVMSSNKFDYQQKQEAITNALNNDKFTWQQKQDLLSNYDKDRTYQLSLDKASSMDTPENKAEWEAAGSPGSYSSFLIRKGTESTKPANASQSAAAGYALRMKTSMDGVAKLSEWFSKQGLMKQGFINSDTWANFMKSDEGKAMDQYERDFINAVLRKESGAAIAPSEFDSAKKQYFPSAGDSAAIIKQKLDNMKTKLDGVLLESGPALSSDFKNNAKTIKFDNLNQYEFFNPDKSAEIDALWDKFPDKTETEILDYFQNQSFNNVGSDTNSATLGKVVAKEDGSSGGQCGRFVNQITGLGVGDTYQSKMSKMDSSITQPAPGMVFTMPYKDTGHTGFIISVNNDGTATVKDSNYSLDGKVKTHKISLSKMTGFARV